MGMASEPGNAATPVMKSDVMKGRSTSERWHEAARTAASRSKCTGISTTGICAMRPTQPLDTSTCTPHAHYPLLLHF